MESRQPREDRGFSSKGARFLRLPSRRRQWLDAHVIESASSRARASDTILITAFSYRSVFRLLPSRASLGSECDRIFIRACSRVYLPRALLIYSEQYTFYKRVTFMSLRTLPDDARPFASRYSHRFVYQRNSSPQQLPYPSCGALWIQSKEK